MANDKYKYSYFVSYNFSDVNGTYGSGYVTINRADKISNGEEVNSVAEFIRKEKGVSKVAIMNFKEFEATPIEDEVKVTRCEKCKYYIDGKCLHDRNSIEIRVPELGKYYKYIDYPTVKPKHFCGYGEKKSGAENGVV